jgi:hypothetical protein
MPTGLRGFQKGHKIFDGSQKGWFKKGHKLSEDTKKQISLRMRGNPKGFKKGCVPWNKGKMGVYTEEIRLKMSVGQIRSGNKPPSRKGMISWNKGKINVYSKETIEKMRLSHLGKYTGENHPNWRGGKSFILYGRDFTNELKTSIRKRDKFTCKICSKNGYDVHHIDYNKKNCSENNLITLCRRCHMKTNFNREYWIKHFNK